MRGGFFRLLSSRSLIPKSPWKLAVFTILEWQRFEKGLEIWVFPKIGIPQNGWLVMGNSIQMDDLGVPLFLETPICI